MQVAGGLEWYPELDGLVFVDGHEANHGDGLARWSRSGNQWSRVPAAMNGINEYHNFAEYNPVHHVMWLGGGSQGSWKLSPTGALTALGSVGYLHAREDEQTLGRSALLQVLIMTSAFGLIMTRDLFNLFIFIEITSIATYALIGMQRTAGGLAAGFKYIIATSVASAFFLLGTIFLYYLTGTLNIDSMVAQRELISRPIGTVATLFLLTRHVAWQASP